MPIEAIDLIPHARVRGCPRLTGDVIGICPNLSISTAISIDLIRHRVMGPRWTMLSALNQIWRGTNVHALACTPRLIRPCCTAWNEPVLYSLKSQWDPCELFIIYKMANALDRAILIDQRQTEIRTDRTAATAQWWVSEVFRHSGQPIRNSALCHWCKMKVLRRALDFLLCTPPHYAWCAAILLVGAATRGSRLNVWTFWLPFCFRVIAYWPDSFTLAQLFSVVSSHLKYCLQRPFKAALTISSSRHLKRTAWIWGFQVSSRCTWVTLEYESQAGLSMHFKESWNMWRALVYDGYGKSLSDSLDMVV